MSKLLPHLTPVAAATPLREGPSSPLASMASPPVPTDRDFCSTALLRTYCEAYFVGKGSLETDPASYERKPLSLCGFQLPKTSELHRTYNDMMEDGKITWAKPLLQVCCLVSALRLGSPRRCVCPPAGTRAATSVPSRTAAAPSSLLGIPFSRGRIAIRIAGALPECNGRLPPRCRLPRPTLPISAGAACAATGHRGGGAIAAPQRSRQHPGTLPLRICSRCPSCGGVAAA